MEPFEDINEDRWVLVSGELCEWIVSASRREEYPRVPYARIPSREWASDHRATITDPVELVFALSAVVNAFPPKHVDLIAWVLHGRENDLIVIEVDGIVLGLHLETEFDEGMEVTSYTLHVRVLDHVPSITATVSPGTREVFEELDDVDRMGWEIAMPTRGETMDILRYIFHGIGMRLGEPRVSRMDSLSISLSGFAKKCQSYRAYAYRDFIDWLTPQVGIDMGGEPWYKETYLWVEDADGTPENKSVVRTVLLKHPLVRGKLILKTTEWDGLPGWNVTLHAYSDTGSIDTTINQPTQAQIAEIITRWWRLGETIPAKEES
jgi:hypothetical protein|nr:MAG TPA: hypothetical protein [Caudoviricetes sp.]